MSKDYCLSPKWTEKEIYLLSVLRPTLTTKEIVNVFNKLGFHRSRSSIQKKAKQLFFYFEEIGLPNLAQLTLTEQHVVNDVLIDRYTVHDPPGISTANPLPLPITSSQKAKRTKELNGIANDLLFGLKEVRETVPHYGSIALYTSKTSFKESMVILLSDWHYGHIVHDTLNNKEIFNSQIAIERIESTAHLIFNNFTLKEVNNRFDECIVLLAGDMITGEGIFAGQEMLTHEHAADQVTRCTKATWSFLRELKSIFPTVSVITVRGNHGRTNGSPEANWDTMIYQQLEILIDLEEDSNFRIKNRYGLYNDFAVKGWRGHLRHAAPVQGDTVAGASKFTSWHMIHDWDLFCYGHYHHWGIFTVNGKTIFRNGSLVGGDEYSEQLAKTDYPAQLCWTVNEENPCVAIYPIIYT